MNAFSSLAVAISLFAPLVLSGCASASRLAETPLQPSYAVSRQGLLHYRVPVGWFDATNDAQSVGAEIWLVKNDYTATISVGEITVDAETRQTINSSGLMRLANLSLSLMGGGGSTTLINPPEPVLLEGRTACSYTVLRPGPGDTLRVVLLPAGEKVFEVVALVSGGQQRVSSEEVFSAQQSFLRAMRE